MAWWKRVPWVVIAHQHCDLFRREAHRAWRRLLFVLAIEAFSARALSIGLVSSTEATFDVIEFTVIMCAVGKRTVGK
jgi:hypothetical protein